MQKINLLEQPINDTDQDISNLVEFLARIVFGQDQGQDILTTSSSGTDREASLRMQDFLNLDLPHSLDQILIKSHRNFLIKSKVL